MQSNDSTYYRVDANTKERLSFRNNTDRKIINVDLEFLEKHPSLHVTRIPIKLPNTEVNEGDKDKTNKKKKMEKKKGKKEANDDPEREDKMTFGYKQIVIFDHESNPGNKN
jgi:hypothetical protein